MINELFTPSTIERLRQGPLDKYLDVYTAVVAEQGYAPNSIRSQIVVIADLSQWLQQKRIAVPSLDSNVLDRFLKRRTRQGGTRRGDGRALNRLLALLCERGIVKPDREQTVESPRQRVINGFQHYCLQERRLSPATPHSYLPVIDQFLSERFPRKVLNLSAIRAADVTNFVRRHAHQLSPGRAALMVTALRSFFRYLLHRGDVATDLAAWVPTVPKWKFSVLPRFLSAASVQRVLDGCDRQTSIGRRNYAILLLLARLGFRAGEVVGLNLEDIDWKEEIAIRGKGGKPVLMPLPVDVGEAIATYLRRDRARCSVRRVFQRVLAIPNQRQPRAIVDFLTRPEIDALLAVPDRETWLGRRDHAFLLTAVQTGLRLSEMTGLRHEDVSLGAGAHVHGHGKGRKGRCTPLAEPTVAVLKAWIREPGREDSKTLFPSTRGGRLSAVGVQHMVARHVAVASATCTTLAKKRVSPHVLRHTAAMELLQAGVERAVIAQWLGHESVDQ